MKEMLKYIRSTFFAIALILGTCFNAYADSPVSTVKDDYNGTYENEAINLENGSKIIFDSQNELKHFLMYYFDNYRLNNYNVLYYSGHTNMGYSVYIDDLSPYNREDTENYIVNTFGITEGDTQEAKIYDVCNKLKDYFFYDLNYANTDLITSIRDKKGVCWQYAKVASVILQNSGVNARTVTGYLNGNYHMWIVCDSEDKKIYSDPTSYGSGNINDWNICQENYQNKYIENNGDVYCAI